MGSTSEAGLAELSADEHEHSVIIEQAAMWLADQNPSPRPTAPKLRQRFGLAALQACEAIAMVDRFRIYRKTHG
ncbi:hypothetical protein C7449_103506 [Mycoplana dimorpha]|uniref:Uncharacterized protein n=1 Tax=Mycoplana dimorpha TaxID=28320 RepID=A0A2T5BBX7_MYCDI|nr:hypothetical protein C7449_103506 [Mycoplana dimorpha]